MADQAAHKLMAFIIHTRLSTLEEKQAEFATRAIDPGDQPQVMSSHEIQTEEDAAQSLFPAFHAGLQAAAAARAGNTPFVLDDSDLQQDAMAAALIRFLVKSHLATVETEELGADHYRYRLAIDWAGLEQTAQLAGVDLNAATAAA